MGRSSSAGGDPKEIQVGSENDMITLLDLKTWNMSLTSGQRNSLRGARRQAPEL